MLLQSCLKPYLLKDTVSLAAFTMKYCTKYILLTDLLSLALSAEPLDYRINTLLHSSTQLSQRTASCLSKDAVLSLTRAGNSLIR